MTDLLLIHGAGQGAWVWDYVKGALEDALRRQAPLYHELYNPGTVLTPDLPAHGSRWGKEDPARITFDLCVEDLLRQAAAARLRRPVLVAHDFGGLLALEMARRLPEKPLRIVFVGAVVPDLFHTPPETLFLPIRVLFWGQRLLPGAPRGCLKWHPFLARWLLCSDMPYYQAAAQVVGRLRPLPLGLLDTLPQPEALEPPCPVTYIVLLRDWFLWPDIQRRMAASVGAHVVELDAGHQAPLSRPQEVAQAILGAAAPAPRPAQGATARA